MRNCEVTECVLVCFFDLTASLDPESDIFSVSSPNFQSKGCVSQTLPSLRSGASGTLCEQSKRASISVERPPVKVVPEAVRN